MKDYEVTIKWVWQDVKELKKDWSKKKCLTALHDVGRHLKDRSIEEGWVILSQLIDES